MTLTDHCTCPRCDHAGGLDGQGAFTKETETRSLSDDDKINQKIERWYQLRCPQCDAVFAIRKQVKRQTFRAKELTRRDGSEYD